MNVGLSSCSSSSMIPIDDSMPILPAPWTSGLLDRAALDLSKLARCGIGADVVELLWVLSVPRAKLTVLTCASSPRALLNILAAASLDEKRGGNCGLGLGELEKKSGLGGWRALKLGPGKLKQSSVCLFRGFNRGFLGNGSEVGPLGVPLGIALFLLFVPVETGVVGTGNSVVGVRTSDTDADLPLPSGEVCSPTKDPHREARREGFGVVWFDGGSGGCARVDGAGDSLTACSEAAWMVLASW